MPYGDPIPAGVNTLMSVMGQAHHITGACPHCSGSFNAVFHAGACPRVKAVEYHPNGTVKRIEFRED